MKLHFAMLLICALNSQLTSCSHLNQQNLDESNELNYLFQHFNQTYLNQIKRPHFNQSNAKIFKRIKRSIDFKNRNKGVRSCNCKLRSSSPAVTLNEEKLDFICNCRRAADQLVLFKQHKSTEDAYMPTSSIRTSYRSRNYRNRNRNRDLYRKQQYPFEYERHRRRKKPRFRLPSNSASNLYNEDQIETVKESIKELNLSNETNQNEYPSEHFSEMMCSCNADGCTGNCGQLSGCVCNDKMKCWGDSCRSPLSTLNMNINPQLSSSSHLNSYLNPQLNHHAHLNRISPSDLIEMIYLTKNKRIKKFKNVNEIYGPAESTLMSRINRNLDHPSFFQPIHPVVQHPVVQHPIDPSLIMQSIHSSMSPPMPFITQPSSRITFKTMILNEMENSIQPNNGVCNCQVNGRCSGLECNNLRGCICDAISCYGLYCNLIKNYNSGQFQQNPIPNGNIRPAVVEQDYEFRQIPSSKVRYHHPSLNNFYDQSQDKQPTIDLPQTISKELPIKEFEIKELAKESKTIKCEKIIDELAIKQNKTVPLKVPANEEKPLNAYEMKVVKLTPVSSSQYLDGNKDNTITISGDQFQNRLDKNKDNFIVIK